MPKPSNEQLLAILSALIREAPPFEYGAGRNVDDNAWLGRAEAVLDAAGNVAALIPFRTARDNLYSMRHDRNDLMVPLQFAYHRLELLMPAGAQGAFIPGDSSWNGFAALAKVLQPPCDEHFLVDPYLDASAVLDLVPLSGARRLIRCLTVMRQEYAPALETAARRWMDSENGRRLPLEIRYAATKDLHDRLIIVDKADAWLVSQSFKDIAKKSPASVQKADRELVEAKVAHYNYVWSSIGS